MRHTVDGQFRTIEQTGKRRILRRTHETDTMVIRQINKTVGHGSIGPVFCPFGYHAAFIIADRFSDTLEAHRSIRQSIIESPRSPALHHPDRQYDFMAATALRKYPHTCKATSDSGNDNSPAISPCLCYSFVGNTDSEISRTTDCYTQRIRQLHAQRIGIQRQPSDQRVIWFFFRFIRSAYA